MLDWLSRIGDFEIFIASTLFAGGIGAWAYLHGQPAFSARLDEGRLALASGEPAVDRMRLKGHGETVRVWARLACPAGFSLRVTGLSRMALMISSDVEIGSARFRGRFHVATSDPEAARLVLDDAICARLLAIGAVEFKLGSMDTLLGADYRDMVADTEQRIRSLWMIVAPHSRVGSVGIRHDLVLLGQDLAAAVERVAADRPSDAVQTGFAEGNWY